ncbi:MAG: hypothetical protein QOD82_6115, partial [Pseudonocardiales bacterium]|nr:hypothetical protein [Pseudonocardiales bacterium]
AVCDRELEAYAAWVYAGDTDGA